MAASSLLIQGPLALRIRLLGKQGSIRVKRSDVIAGLSSCGTT